MQSVRRALYRLILIVSFAALSLPVVAQQVIATVPVDFNPISAAINSGTNKIYVTNACGSDSNCAGDGTVSVIDGSTLATTSITVGSLPNGVAVNSVTNRIYVANECGNDVSCNSWSGTVTVLDGASLATTNIFVGNDPYGLALNSLTNRVYVANNLDATVSVIDGTPPTALQFVAVTPCRVIDTRPQHGGGGPIQGGTHQDFSPEFPF
jgi:DNA-binding beta-propeller fold protein YncE